MRPVTLMSVPTFKLFNRQLCLMWLSVFGRVEQSLRVTRAPSFDANIPGRAVPDPSSRMFLSRSVSRWLYKNKARKCAEGQV